MKDWAYVLLVGIAIFLIIEVEKAIQNRITENHSK
jgi:hypothetical protein